MWRSLLLFLLLLFVSLAIQAPATVLDGWLQQASSGRLFLIDAHGSLWHGEARLSARDATSGEPIPITPVSWQWRPLDMLRARITWAFSAAGLPPFLVGASPSGVTAAAVAIQLPVREVLDQIPVTIARAGWHGDLSLNADRWSCSWHGICDGHAEVFWRGAASDLFPNRAFGDYRLVMDSVANDTSLKLDTLSGEIKLNASGQISPQGAARLQGSVEGDPAFVGRLPDVASRWVQRTDTPGRILFNVDSGPVRK